MTVSGFNSWCWIFISVCNQLLRSTQPSHPIMSRHNEYQQTGSALCGRYGLCITHGPYLNPLEMGHNKVLYKFTLLYFTLNPPLLLKPEQLLRHHNNNNYYYYSCYNPSITTSSDAVSATVTVSGGDSETVSVSSKPLAADSSPGTATALSGAVAAASAVS